MGHGGRGVGGLIRVIFRVVFVRLLFGTIGFWPAIALLAAIGLGVFFYFRRRRV